MRRHEDAAADWTHGATDGLGDGDGQHHRPGRADGLSISFSRSRPAFSFSGTCSDSSEPTRRNCIAMFVVLKEFLPPDPKVQDILDAAVASVVVTGSSGWLANVGIIVGIYFGTMFISTDFARSSQTHGVDEDRNWWSKYIISFFLLFWFGITILVCFNAIVFGETLAGIAEVNFQLRVPLQEWVGGAQSALYRDRPYYSRARSLSPDAGKLSHHSAGAARCHLFCGRLDGRDEALPVLCRKIRSLQPDLSRPRLHHHSADLDVSDLSVLLLGEN